MPAITVTGRVNRFDTRRRIATEIKGVLVARMSGVRPEQVHTHFVPTAPTGIREDDGFLAATFGTGFIPLPSPRNCLDPLRGRWKLLTGPVCAVIRRGVGGLYSVEVFTPNYVAAASTYLPSDLPATATWEDILKRAAWLGVFEVGNERDDEDRITALSLRYRDTTYTFYDTDSAIAWLNSILRQKIDALAA